MTRDERIYLDSIIIQIERNQWKKEFDLFWNEGLPKPIECKCGCGKIVKQNKLTGRIKLYYSDSCKTRASRLRVKRRKQIHLVKKSA